MNNKKQRFLDVIEFLLFSSAYFLMIQYTQFREKPWLLVGLFLIYMFYFFKRDYKRYLRNVQLYKENKILEITEESTFAKYSTGILVFIIPSLILMVFCLGVSIFVELIPLAFTTGILLFRLMFDNKIFVNRKQIIYSQLGVLFDVINIDEIEFKELREEGLLMIYTHRHKKKEFKKSKFSEKDWKDLIICLKPQNRNK